MFPLNSFCFDLLLLSAMEGFTYPELDFVCLFLVVQNRCFDFLQNIFFLLQKPRKKTHFFYFFSELVNRFFVCFISPYLWGDTAQSPSFLKMVLGQVLYLEWAQVHPFVPMNLLSPVLNPSAGCQGICPGSLLVTHAAAPCDNFKVFVHFPPRFLFISLGFSCILNIFFVVF